MHAYSSARGEPMTARIHTFPGNHTRRITAFGACNIDYPSAIRQSRVCSYRGHCASSLHVYCDLANHCHSCQLVSWMHFATWGGKLRLPVNSFSPEKTSNESYRLFKLLEPSRARLSELRNRMGQYWRSCSTQAGMIIANRKPGFHYLKDCTVLQ